MLKRFGFFLVFGCLALACSDDGGGDDNGTAEQNSGSTDNGGNDNGGGDNGGGDNGGGDNGGGDNGGGDNGGGDNGGGDNGGSDNAGQTPCGNFPEFEDKFCQAGQYCKDMTFSECASGCLSDNNCASNQTCAKENGEQVGVCQNKPMMVDGECEAVCTKMKACDPTITNETCNQFCAGVSSACRACVADANCADPEACLSACGFE